MSEKLAWFPFYVRDWMTDEKVLAMTFAEQGVYLRLLCLQWLEGSIPASQARLERSLRLASSGELGGTVEVADLRGVVKDCFKPHPTLEGRLANPKLLQIAEAQQLEAGRRAESGRKGGLRSAQARLKPGSTKPETETEEATAAREPQGGTVAEPQQPSPDSLSYAQRCTVAANRGLAAALGGQFNELVTSAQHAAAADLTAAGVPIAFAERIIAEKARAYRPNGRNTQPRALRYFVGAVLDAFEQDQEHRRAGAASRSGEKRLTKVDRSAATAALTAPLRQNAEKAERAGDAEQAAALRAKITEIEQE
jgi:hypothetical protein